ncbi:MAG: ADP-ribosylglycohydrolase family protein, partial [Ferruginibacter sp.]
AENINFKYTTISLNDVYEISYRHALKNIEQNGGNTNGSSVVIKSQQPVAVRYEKSFDGQYPITLAPVKWNENRDELSFDFEGTGFVLKGDASVWDSKSTYNFTAELYLDGRLTETLKLPVSYTERRYDLAWKYQLPVAKHSVKMKILNPSKEYQVRASQAIIYSNQPVDGMQLNINAANK